MKHHINELGPHLSLKKLKRVKIRVTLVHKKGPLVRMTSAIGEQRDEFYKFLFADATGQIDCLMDNEHAKKLYEKLEVGRNYIVEGLNMSEVRGQSILYNLSDHRSMIKNPRITPLSSFIHGVEENRNVRFYFKTFTDVIDSSEKLDLVDVIGKVVSVDKIDFDKEFKEITLQTLDTEDRETKLTVMLWGNNMELVNVPGGIVVFKKAQVRQWECENNKLYVTQATSTFKIETQEDLRYLPNETVLKLLDFFIKLPSLKTNFKHINLISSLIKNAQLETLSLVKQIMKSANITSSVILTLPAVTLDYHSCIREQRQYGQKIPNNIILTDEPSPHCIQALWEFSSEEAIEQINDCMHGPIVCRVTIKMKKNKTTKDWNIIILKFCVLEKESQNSSDSDTDSSDESESSE